MKNAPIEIFNNEISKVFSFLEKKFTVTVFLIFLTSLAIRLVFTPFDVLPQGDGYIYVLKSLEITRGNFTPIRTHAIGWPLVMAFFFYFFKSESIFRYMIYARIISGIIGALCVFPLACIGSKLFNRKRDVFLLLVFFSFSPYMILYSISALSEPLFTFLLLWCIYFIIRAKENRNNILISSIIGAFAYYVRPNGIFILFIILLSFCILSYISRKQILTSDFFYVIFIIFIFFLISAPFLYQRYIHFGSPFFYGENSKFFVDKYEEVWCSNIKNPSIWEYIKTHKYEDYITRFIIDGIGRILVDYSLITNPIILPFFLFGVIKTFSKPEFIPLIVSLVIWIVCFTPIWSIFHNGRHLVPTLPFILAIGVFGLNIFVKKLRHPYFFILVIVTFFILFSLSACFLAWLRYEYYHKPIQIARLKFAEWISKNVKGKIAIPYDGTLIMVYLPDATVGGVGLYDLYAPISNVSIMDPGCFNNISSAMEWFRDMKVTHIVIDKLRIKRKPYTYLKDVLNQKNKKCLIELHSDHNNERKIYYINWSACEV